MGDLAALDEGRYQGSATPGVIIVRPIKHGGASLATPENEVPGLNRRDRLQLSQFRKLSELGFSRSSSFSNPLHGRRKRCPSMFWAVLWRTSQESPTVPICSGSVVLGPWTVQIIDLARGE
jgi:hypothetical protein